MLLRIIFLFILLITQFHIASAQQIVDKIVAKVDNQIILKSEVEISYLQFMRSPEAQIMQTSDDVKCRVLESLIINKMMLARAVMDSVTVEKDVIYEQIDRRMDYFIQQFGTVAKLESYYNKTIDQLKEDLYPQIRDQMVTQKMQNNITAGVTITPNDVKKFFKNMPADSLPFFSSEVEIGQIVRLPEINRKDQLIAKQQLEEIRARIMNGEDFCRLAKQFSQDGSAKNCGEIGFFKKGELVPEYEAAASRLQPGQMSPVIESQYGFHIIQLIERRGVEYNTRHILIKPASTSKDLVTATVFLDSIRQRILIDSISFAKAAKLYSADKQTAYNGGMFTDEQTGGTRIPQEDLQPAVFFVIDTMQVGDISLPTKFTMQDGTEAVRIIFYQKKIPAHQANLIDDYQKIYAAALEEKKNNAVNEWFDKTKSKVFIDINDEYQQCEIMITQQ
ncbi:MAG TPA: peptidylprolyl isomerase [Cytophaga sp.]|jgi:peptidyl-prolyl cis-trans isomerase SurA|nr:peptidylprolyl isomerase [Cytophaga sp.]